MGEKVCGDRTTKEKSVWCQDSRNETFCLTLCLLQFLRCLLIHSGVRVWLNYRLYKRTDICGSSLSGSESITMKHFTIPHPPKAPFLYLTMQVPRVWACSALHKHARTHSRAYFAIYLNACFSTASPAARCGSVLRLILAERESDRASDRAKEE